MSRRGARGPGGPRRRRGPLGAPARRPRGEPPTPGCCGRDVLRPPEGFGVLREVKHFQPGGELAPGFAGPTRQWLLVLLDSGPRARPRSEATIYAYSRPAHLILQEWGRTYDHLREVTQNEIE